MPDFSPKNLGAIAVASLAFPTYETPMGQQLRVRTKRKRRLAYLQRKKESLRAVRPKSPRAKPKKAAAVEESARAEKAS
jgi:hypothetical protein